VTLHPTKEALISTAAALMETQAIGDITSEQVLEISGISRGSLYHHFEDFAELIEAAQVRRFTSYVDSSIKVLWSVLSASKSRDEMVIKIREVTSLTQAPIMKKPRLDRVNAIAAITNNPRMAIALGVEQERLTDSIADLYREVCHRGWGNPELDPRTISVMIQAYSLGRVVDDFTPERMDQEKWEKLITTILEQVFFPRI
jgi:AcrR family transcriptional regulator